MVPAYLYRRQLSISTVVMPDEEEKKLATEKSSSSPKSETLPKENASSKETTLSSTLSSEGLLSLRNQLDLLSARLGSVGDCVEAEKLKFATHKENHENIAAKTKLYHDKLKRLRAEMVSLSARSASLRERALKLMETRQEEALQTELRRQAERERDRALMAEQEESEVKSEH